MCVLWNAHESGAAATTESDHYAVTSSGGAWTRNVSASAGWSGATWNSDDDQNWSENVDDSSVTWNAYGGSWRESETYYGDQHGGEISI